MTYVIYIKHNLGFILKHYSGTIQIFRYYFLCSREHVTSKERKQLYRNRKVNPQFNGNVRFCF